MSMKISEAQFASMLQGTIHQGKYGTAPKKVEVEVREHYRPRPKTNHRRSKPAPVYMPETEKLSRDINQAAPYLAFAYAATNPVVWVFVFIMFVLASVAMELVIGLSYFAGVGFALYGMKKFVEEKLK